MTGAAQRRAANVPPRGDGWVGPDFFIVGHGKSGTTALYQMLRRHPQIFMPELKEPRFFASDIGRDSPSSRLPNTLEEYLSLFEAAEPGQRTGEATPSYLRSRTAAKEIAELQPAARIIAILRDPAALVRSQHLQFLSTHVETEADLRKAIALEDARREGRAPPGNNVWGKPLFYSDRICYVEQLRRYHDHFPPEQVMVIIYDDFRADNTATVREIFRFLDVDDEHYIEPIEVNVTIGARSRRLDATVRSAVRDQTPAARALNGTLKTLIPKGLRLRLLQQARRRNTASKAAPADPLLMQELRRRYKHEVAAASDYLGRDLVRLWGYDRLD